ncbi:MAG TPA: hypothetical protein VLD37_03755 [Candidatus Bilamarchaeum sp.]|nr:hypothetical protein [Candidatus Bilamarchaeum sp.]
MIQGKPASTRGTRFAFQTDGDRAGICRTLYGRLDSLAAMIELDSSIRWGLPLHEDMTIRAISEIKDEHIDANVPGGRATGRDLLHQIAETSSGKVREAALSRLK